MSNILKIPGKNGELLCMPPLPSIHSLIKSNIEKFKTYNFTIGKEDVRHFRKMVREKVINLSLNFTSELGIKSYLSDDVYGDILIQTGHQPVFYHPGIIIKNFLMERIMCADIMKGEKANAVNLIVDTDNLKEIYVNIPMYSNGMSRIKETILSNPSPIPYEFSSAPSWEVFDFFIKKVEGYISNPHFKSLYENYLRFVTEINNDRKYFESISAFMTFLRRRYEDKIGSRYLEVPVSHICDTNEFLSFFISIAKESGNFAGIYNYHLKRYRKEHKYRSSANPFPDLKIDDKKIELPFWHYVYMPETASWQRKRIFAEYGENEIRIYFEGNGEINFRTKNNGEEIDAIRKNNIKIRPKAIILTLFNRMFVSDIFIHGIGGARYDTITDRIIKDFYKVEPPGFITVSLTLYPSLNLPEEDYQKRIKELKEKLRDMKCNPYRYITAFLPYDSGSEAEEMLKEKEYLISLFKSCNADRKGIWQQFKINNEKLYQKIKPAVEKFEIKLEILKRQREESEATQRRDYPYFLFSPDDIMNILK